jgi:hypothetical protein
MVLESLISLAFWLKPLAGVIWRVAENLNHLSHIRGPGGQAFPLPSNVHRQRAARNQRWMAGAHVEADKPPSAGITEAHAAGRIST